MRLKLNLVVLVLQDNAYGMIRWKQAVDGFPDYGMTFGDPDFVAYARAYGAKGSRVESADGLAPALEAAFMSGGVHLVSTPIDYSENGRVLVDELRAQGAISYAGPLRASCAWANRSGIPNGEILIHNPLAGRRPAGDGKAVFARFARPGDRGGGEGKY